MNNDNVEYISNKIPGGYPICGDGVNGGIACFFFDRLERLIQFVCLLIFVFKGCVTCVGENFILSYEILWAVFFVFCLHDSQRVYDVSEL